MSDGEINLSDIALKRFFSKRIIGDFITGKSHDYIDYVIERYIDEPDGKKYGTLISEVYAQISDSYRTEYFYKNTLLNKLLFKHHNYKTTSVLTELPIGHAKADFVMINGKGTVYEIKTELDNLDRLSGQIIEYYKAFDRVVVVTYEDNANKVLNIVPETVGVFVLTKKSAIRVERKPIETAECLDARTIFKMMRKQEFENILLEQNKKLPEVSQFEYYKKCFELVNEIDILVLHKSMLKELKGRTDIKVVENSLKTPSDIRLLSYFDRSEIFEETEVSKAFNILYGGY